MFKVKPNQGKLQAQVRCLTNFTFVMLFLLWPGTEVVALEPKKTEFNTISAELACRITLYPEPRISSHFSEARKLATRKTYLKKMTTCKKNWRRFIQNTKPLDKRFSSVLRSMRGARIYYDDLIFTLGPNLEVAKLKTLNGTKYKQTVRKLASYYAFLMDLDRLAELLKHAKSEKNISKIHIYIVTIVLRRSLAGRKLETFPTSTSEYVFRLERSLGNVLLKEREILMLLELYAAKDFLTKTANFFPKYLQVVQLANNKIASGKISRPYRKSFARFVSTKLAISVMLNENNNYWQTLLNFLEMHFPGGKKTPPNTLLAWAFAFQGEKPGNVWAKNAAETFFKTQKRHLPPKAKTFEITSQYLYEKIIRCPNLEHSVCTTNLKKIQAKFEASKFVQYLLKQQFQIIPEDLSPGFSGVNVDTLRQQVK